MLKDGLPWFFASAVFQQFANMSVKDQYRDELAEVNAQSDTLNKYGANALNYVEFKAMHPADPPDSLGLRMLKEAGKGVLGTALIVGTMALLGATPIGLFQGLGSMAATLVGSAPSTLGLAAAVFGGFELLNDAETPKKLENLQQYKIYLGEEARAWEKQQDGISQAIDFANDPNHPAHGKSENHHQDKLATAAVNQEHGRYV